MMLVLSSLFLLGCVAYILINRSRRERRERNAEIADEILELCARIRQRKVIRPFCQCTPLNECAFHKRGGYTTHEDDAA
jgi:hypothetical protein